MMTLLQDGGLEWLDDTGTGTNSCIEEREGSIVRSSDDYITVLVIESHSAQWGWWQKGLLREIGVSQVPDVRLSGHIVWHLLETKHGVSNTYSHLVGLWMPGDAGGRSLNGVWVLEDHKGLGGDVLREMLWLLSREILLEQIDDVVLFDAVGGSLDHLLGSLRETKSGISVHLLFILCNIWSFLGIDFSGPSSFSMFHSLGEGWNSLSVN